MGQPQSNDGSSFYSFALPAHTPFGPDSGLRRGKELMPSIDARSLLAILIASVTFQLPIAPT